VKPFESNNTCDPAKPAQFTKTVMVLPIAAALGEMLVTCGDHIEPQLHSFKKFSEELGKLLRGSLPLWAKSTERYPSQPHATCQGNVIYVHDGREKS